MPDVTPRVAVVGCGAHASQAILPALRTAAVDLVAVCDLDADRAETAARRFGAPAWHTDVGALLAGTDADAVVVVGPPALHHSAGLDVLRSGRHLFVEKPPGLHLRQAQELVAAADEHGCRFMVGLQKRYARAYQIAAGVLARPDFGAPTLLRLNYSHVRYQPLREHLAVMSIHAFDLAAFFLGPVTGGTLHKRRHGEDHVLVLTLEHGGGALSVLTLSALEPRVQETVEIAGRSTLLRVRDLSELIVEGPAPSWQEAIDTDDTVSRRWRPDMTIPVPGSDSLVLQGYAGQFAAMAGALATGTPYRPGPEEALAAMRLVEAVERAPEGASTLDLTAGG